MSFEFKLRRNKGKNKHKFNRHEIWNKLGDIQRLSMHKNPLGWDMAVNDTYPTMWKDMCRFLDSHLGEDINEVFSKFLKKVRSPKKYNNHLKQIFWDEYLGHRSEYCVGSDNKLYKHTYKWKNTDLSYSTYNYKHINDKLTTKLKFVNGPLYIGLLYDKQHSLIPVWIVSTMKYDTVKDALLDNNRLRPWFNTINLEGLSPITSKNWFYLRNFNKVNVCGFGEQCILENTQHKIIPSWEMNGIPCYFITKK